jgi:hypothetical protein
VKLDSQIGLFWNLRRTGHERLALETPTFAPPCSNPTDVGRNRPFAALAPVSAIEKFLILRLATHFLAVGRIGNSEYGR